MKYTKKQIDKEFDDWSFKFIFGVPLAVINLILEIIFLPIYMIGALYWSFKEISK